MSILIKELKWTVKQFDSTSSTVCSGTSKLVLSEGVKMKRYLIFLSIVFLSCAGTRNKEFKLDYQSFKMGVSVVLIETARRELNYNSFDDFYKTVFSTNCADSLNIDEPSFRIGVVGAISCIQSGACFGNPEASVDEFSLCIFEKIKTQLQ